MIVVRPTRRPHPGILPALVGAVLLGLLSAAAPPVPSVPPLPGAAAAPEDDEFLLHAFAGKQAGERFGASVSSAGDFDGDGFDDLIIGMPGHAKKGVDAGAVTIISGRKGKELATLYGKQGDLFGASVSEAGDLNADGFGDVVVGAPGADDGKGAAYLLLGKKAKLRLLVEGEQEGEQLGWSVSAAGDVDQDGFFDVILGAPYHDGTAGQDAGRVIVVSGKSKKEPEVLWSWEGGSEGERLGWSVGATENVLLPAPDEDTPEDERRSNNNRDLVLAAPGARQEPGGPRVGAVRIFDGLNGELRFERFGRNEDGGFGHAVHGAGDVNSDSWADVIVGSDGVPGEALVISGKDGKPLMQLTHERSDLRFGHAVSGLGDVDDDGYDDVLVGIPGDAALVEGGTAPDVLPSVRVYSGHTGTLLLEIFGDSAEDGLGVSVAIAGDLDADDNADIIVGADQFGIRAGYARAYRGNQTRR